MYQISQYLIDLHTFHNIFFISIEKIKEKRDQENSNVPDPDCPPGHVKVDNVQRVATLQQLQYSKFN